jgi:N-methylhydantoinase B
LNGLAQVPPHGFGGGMPPSAGDYYILRDTNLAALLADRTMPTEPRLEADRETTRNKITHMVLSRGDIFVAASGGGGGLGDPLLRDPATVGRDVADRYLTVDHARAAYGVVVDEDGAVQEDATAERRADMRRARIGSDPEREASITETVGVAVVQGVSGWTCAYCEHQIAGDGDWREGDGIVIREVPVAERFAELGMTVRDRTEAPRVVLREHFCGACASALGAETLTEGLRAKPAEPAAKTTVAG